MLGLFFIGMGQLNAMDIPSNLPLLAPLADQDGATVGSKAEAVQV